MKILSASQIREADSYTIKHEPISSAALMERAASACVEWLLKHQSDKKQIYIFCGSGNNGGDGLAIARMLHEQRKDWVKCFRLPADTYSKDHLDQWHKNKMAGLATHHISESSDFPNIPKDSLIIDALYGTGLNRPIEGQSATLIQKINRSSSTRIAIDIPSGLYTDKPSSKEDPIVKADICLSFEFAKLAFLLPENGDYCKKWITLPIGLSNSFIENCNSHYYLIDFNTVRESYRHRVKFSHKGTYGHVCMVAGSYGKGGAAALAGKASLKSGAGLLSYIVPECVYQTVQQLVPEAMVMECSGLKYIEKIPHQSKFRYAIGPGLSEEQSCIKALLSFLRKQEEGIVLDADALNIIAKEKALAFVPKGSILSPHPKEFERLFGKQANQFERLDTLRSEAIKLQSVIILKGAHSCIGLPNGELYFNASGNPGLATAGSGDVLTGLIVSLLAQSYPIDKAAIMAVYIHGKAAEIAFEKGESHESITAQSVIEQFGAAFRSLY